MNSTWVLDASPIILLGKAGLLETISPLADGWIIPEGVIAEVTRKRALEPYLVELAKHAQVIRKSVATVSPAIAAWDLGRGESEVLTVALTAPDPRTGVVLDDLQARKCAALYAIPLIGSLGLLILAKQRGVLPNAKPAIDRLIASGLYIDPVMLRRILAAIAEDSY